MTRNIYFLYAICVSQKQEVFEKKENFDRIDIIENVKVSR